MESPLYIAFVWHMHQPYYRDLATGRCSMPWVRLHAAKDYLDMLKRLESFPTLHQTFNFVPSLLDQFTEYLPPTNASDEFLEVSRKPAAQLSLQEQRFILEWFFLANWERMIKPYPRYHDLLVKRGFHVDEHDWPTVLARCTTQDLLDLQVWFNLAWIDPWLRANDPRLSKLEQQGAWFTEQDKAVVLNAHMAYLAALIPAYRAAAERGSIELTSSPYYHPIVPLLCDLRTALVALPHLPLPRTSFRHPDDARRQLQEGFTRHQEAFGRLPNGVWPPEGSVSEELVTLALEAQVRWIATDEEILWRTLRTRRSPELLYRPHRIARNGGQLAVIFRDRELSDLIGFVYSQWDPTIAVEDFLKRLAAIHEQMQALPHPALVSIILDGENAWEFYPNDGHEFLMALYRALADDPRFRCVTVSEFLADYPLERMESLPEIFPGSWIDANFATWVGHPEKNAAWEHLAAAREALLTSRNQTPQARRSLGIAEGSDWMWWFGDTHFSAQAAEFDRIFRIHLTNCYRLSGLEVPPALQEPIRREIIAPTSVPTSLIHPTLDGRDTSYYEWLFAGRIDLTRHYTAMHRGEQCLRTFYYGFDRTQHYVRLDVHPTQLNALGASWTIELGFPHGLHVEVAPSSQERTKLSATLSSSPAQPSVPLPCAYEDVVELAIPSSFLKLDAGAKLQLTLTLRRGRDVLERHPPQGVFELASSLDELDAQIWSVL